MTINGLWLQNFRNIEDQYWQFDTGLNLFVAPNGTGKSNLIEAICLLSTGKSWRANKTDQLISWQQEVAQLKTLVELADGEQVQLQQTLTTGSVNGQRTASRLYKLNGVNKRQADVSGELLTVLFTPEDMLVFQVGPSARRQLLDNVLAQTDRQYEQSLSQYDKALRRRNKLIRRLREGEVDRYDFFYWDNLLIEHGLYLQQEREKFLQWLEKQAGITEDYHLFYDPSVISEERLRQYAQAEVGAGHTLVGPHKDDWLLQIKRGNQWQDIVTFGSRGEQRLSLVWFKLQELAYIQQVHQEKPVLLLDDVFSELDEKNSQLLLEATTDLQTIVTTVPGQEVKPGIAKKLLV